MNKHLAEFIGIIMGDGYLNNTQNHYRIGIVGDPVGDREYFEYIKRLVRTLLGKDIKPTVRARGLCVVINDKRAFLELTERYGLPIGVGKSECVVIPSIIADKPGCPNYPSIEISTNSVRLANQLKTLLAERGFRVGKIWSYQSKMSAFPSTK